MRLTKSPLGIFLITAIALGGVLDIWLPFSANGVSCFLCDDVCVCERERQHWEGIGLSWNSVMPQQTIWQATGNHRE